MACGEPQAVLALGVRQQFPKWRLSTPLLWRLSTAGPGSLLLESSLGGAGLTGPGTIQVSSVTDTHTPAFLDPSPGLMATGQRGWYILIPSWSSYK